MKVNFKIIIVYIIVFTFLFQDTFLYYLNSPFLNNLDELFILLYALTAFVFCIKRGKVNKSGFFILGFALIYLLVGIISGVLNSNYQLNSLYMGGLLMVKIYILIFSVANYPLKKSSIVNIINALKLAGFICAIVGIFNFIFPSIYLKIFSFGFIDLRMGFPSVMSLFIHPGQFGWFMLFIAFYYFSEYIMKQEKKFLNSFIFFALMAFLSFKVKVIIGILAALLVYVYIIEKRKIKPKYFILMVSIFAIIWSLFGKLIHNTYLLYFTQTGTTSARYALTNTSLEIMKDYFPMGVGFGKFASWYARLDYSEFYYKYNINNVYGLNPENPVFATDTYWPAVFGETGFIGFILCIVVLIYIFKKLISKLRENKTSYSIFAIFIFVQTIAESTGEQIFNSSPQNIFIGIVIGLALSNRGGDNEKNRILYA